MSRATITHSPLASVSYVQPSPLSRPPHSLFSPPPLPAPLPSPDWWITGAQAKFVLAVLALGWTAKILEKQKLLAPTWKTFIISQRGKSWRLLCTLLLLNKLKFTKTFSQKSLKGLLNLACTYKVYFHKIAGNKKGLHRRERREVGWHLATRLVMKILLGSSMKISGLRENQTWNKNRETSQSSQSHLTQTEVRKLKLILLEFKLSRRLLSRCVSATTTWDRSWGQLGEKWKTYQHSYMAASTITDQTSQVLIFNINIRQSQSQY